MWAWLVRWLLGSCPRCDERGLRVVALEKQNQDLLDRLMSRDYSHVAFVRAQIPAMTPAKTGDGDAFDASGDGLDG